MNRPDDNVEMVSHILEQVPHGQSDVTITINARGEINVDQSALSNVLESGQQSARVTFVRVGEEGATVENQVELDASELLAAVGGGGHVDSEIVDESDSVSVAPMLMLDQDQMNKLETVLQSDEARNLLGPLGDGLVGVQREDDEFSSPGSKRRSQRQVDKEHREQADKIRAENRREMMSSPGPSINKTMVFSPGRGRGRGRGGSMMRGGIRPKRETRLPAHLNDDQIDSPLKASKVPGDADDDDLESEDGSWASEDDPDRLWCVCQQPHNNRFMICCDICLDWFHGKCVGITKQQGKEMEEAGQDWKCPKCLEGLQAGDNTATEELLEEDTGDTLEEDLDAEMEVEEASLENTSDNVADEFMPNSPQKLDTSRLSEEGRSARAQARKRRSSSSTSLKEKQAALTEKKPKVPTCHMCPNIPMESSIYCSKSCVDSHVAQALKLLNKDGKDSKPKEHVVVLEPKTNTLLNGPNAPTQGSLGNWLSEHPTFSVVMPKKPESAKFYGHKNQNQINRGGIRLIPPHREHPDQARQRNISGSDKKSPGKLKIMPNIMDSVKNHDKNLSKEEIIAEAKASLQRMKSREGVRVVPRKERKMSDTVKPIVKRQRSIVVKEPEVKESYKLQDNKSLRTTVVKGVKEALNEKLESCSDLKMDSEKVAKIAEQIEIAMFGTFGDTGAKYKNKYRSLTYNIKDLKNDGLFRRILLKDLSPIEVVGMSADEYASKELQQWRKAEAKKDIEAIKSYELDLLALGDTYVMKSHKGEQVIEKPEGGTPDKKSIPILPEDVPDADASPKKDKGPSQDTWDHPNHGDVTVEPKCEVCNGVLSLQAFVTLKVNKETERERRRRSSEKKRSRSISRSRKHKKSSSNHKRSSGHKSSSDHKSSSTHKSNSEHKSSSGHKSSSDHKSSSSRHRSSSDNKSSSRGKDRQQSDKDRQKRNSNGNEKSGRIKEDENSDKMSQEKADLQEKINKATAAIEAAKKSGETMTKVIQDHASDSSTTDMLFQDEPVEMDIDIAIAADMQDMESPPQLMRRSSSGADGEVSSTVTISTPEPQWSEDPSVWEGQIIMQDVAKFSVSGHQVSGTSDYLTVDLKDNMNLVGRIPPKICWDYIDKIGKNPLKEILVLRFSPADSDEESAYSNFFTYLQTRDRFGVVGNTNKMVKDCYIMPLAKDSPVPSALLPLEGQGLPLNRSNLLLGILVRAKRARPGENSIITTTPKKKPQEPVVPSLPTLGGSGDSPYSPPGDESPNYQTKVSQDVGGFTEKLAKLQAEVAAKRAELRKREEGVKVVLDGVGLGVPLQLPFPPPMLKPPTPVFSTDVIHPAIPGNQTGYMIGGSQHVGTGVPSPNMMGGGDLRGLSNEELMVKVMSQEGVGGSLMMPPRSLPPPGPGMPGNLLGQGVGNLELAREEEERGHWGEASRGFRGHQGGSRGDRRGDRDWERRDRYDEDINYDDRRGFRDRPRGDRRDLDRRERDWEEEERGSRREDSRGDRRQRRDIPRERVEWGDRRRDRRGGWSDEGDVEVVQESIPLKIPHHDKGDSSSAKLKSFHRDVAAELAAVDKEFSLPATRNDYGKY